MMLVSSVPPAARAWGTSVSASAERMRYSRIMVSLRPSGTLRGGRRRAQRCSPRQISKISLEAPPEMNRLVMGSPWPGRPWASIHSPSATGSIRPLVRSASEASSVSEREKTLESAVDSVGSLMQQVGG